MTMLCSLLMPQSKIWVTCVNLQQVPDPELMLHKAMSGGQQLAWTNWDLRRLNMNCG